MKLTKLKNRILFVSPTVQAGWQEQSYRTDFQVLKELGRGTFGVVWKGRHKKTDKIYAIKEIKKKTINSPSALEHMRNQIKILYSLNHPNIIKLYNHFEDELSIYLVLEYAEKGQLYQLLTHEKCFPEQISSKYISQIVSAVRYVHQHNIVHRDIKPENILIDSKDCMKLADFGWSNFFDKHQKRQTYCGTLDYLAPQMLTSQHKHDSKVDNWCIGVLIYELCTGFSPFSSELIKTNSVTEQRVKHNIFTLKYSIPSHISKECSDLITKLIKRNPSQRISLQEVLKHPWITKYSKQQDNINNQSENWMKDLRNQFQQIDETNNEFSKDQIYQYSRLQSIINLKGKKNNESNQNKKVAQLQITVKKLEWQKKMDQKQIKILKGDIFNCQNKIQKLQNIISQQNRQLQILTNSLAETEKRLKDKV